jgi:hypothetical protein
VLDDKLKLLESEIHNTKFLALEICSKKAGFFSATQNSLLIEEILVC